MTETVVTTKPTIEQLNAYVDGELSPDNAAKIANAIANDAEIAQMVSKLSMVKASLPGAVPERPTLSFEQDEFAKAPPFIHASTLIKAACIAFLFIAAGLITYRSLAPDVQDSSWKQIAVTQHNVWAGDDGSVAKTGLNTKVSASGDFFRPPDLSAAKLSLVFSNTSKIGTSTLIHYGYTGTRGCRLSLFVAEPAALQPKKIERNMAIEYSEWQAGGRSYLLLSTGMDHERFANLAATIERYSNGQKLIDGETRLQMAMQRKDAAPCAA